MTNFVKLESGDYIDIDKIIKIERKKYEYLYSNKNPETNNDEYVAIMPKPVKHVRITKNDIDKILKASEEKTQFLNLVKNKIDNHPVKYWMRTDCPIINKNGTKINAGENVTKLFEKAYDDVGNLYKFEASKKLLNILNLPANKKHEEVFSLMKNNEVIGRLYCNVNGQWKEVIINE